METISAVTLGKEACPITLFIIALGQKLLEEKVKDWMDSEEVAVFCRTHEIQLNGKYPGADELETELTRFFHPTGEFYAPGLNVDGYERPRGWDRPFQIRAYRYSPALTGSLASESGDVEVQDSDIANMGYKVTISPSPISYLP